MSHKVATPLSRTCVLAAVTVSQWTARRLDRKITDEVNTAHGATKDAGRYNKLLIDSVHLEKLTKLVSKARTLHYSLTKPWLDDGPRILPNALYARFTDEFRNLKREFEVEADRFCRAYPDYVAERKVKLNGMFREEDYPSASEIREKFSLEHRIMAFPDVEDFRADLDDDTLSDIKSEMVESTERVTRDAMKHTAEQIRDVVGHMAEKLAEYSEKRAEFKEYKGRPSKAHNKTALDKKQKATRVFFMDSLVDNVRELADLLPAFNLTNDAKLAEIAKRISKELCVEDAAELRKNDVAREVVQKSADEIVAEVGKFLA